MGEIANTVVAMEFTMVLAILLALAAVYQGWFAWRSGEIETRLHGLIASVVMLGISTFLFLAG
jgi:hypothetical protein